MEYILYMHTFPNGKKYVGITGKTMDERYAKGRGYTNNKKMNAAIERYGWENIKHEVLASGLSRSEAKKAEMEAIKKYDSIKHGYNRASGGAVGRSYFMPHTILWFQKGKHYPDFKKQCEHWLTYADDPKVATIINFGDLLIQESEWFKNDGYDEFEKIAGYLKGLYDWFVSGIDVSASSYNAYKELHKVCREVFDKKTEEGNASIED